MTPTASRTAPISRLVSQVSMNRTENKRARATTGTITSSDVTIYLVLVGISSVAQFFLNANRGMVHALAWTVINAFVLAVLIFGWARSNPKVSGE